MSHMNYEQRISQLTSYLGEKNISCALVTNGVDISYLTGLPLEQGVFYLVITPSAKYLITDGRYEVEAHATCPDFELVIRPVGIRSTFASALNIIAELHPQNLAFDFSVLPYAAAKQVEEKLAGIELIDSDLGVRDQRAQKSPEELELIRHACKISQLSFYALLDYIKPGVTEKAVADQLEYEFRKRGGDGYCFETIVASGPNGALPHAGVTDRQIQAGDFVTIDFGTAYKGYCSDITRTVSVGKPANPELVRMFEATTRAKQAGQDILAAGKTPQEIHAAISRVMDSYGYVTPHGYGHSFGLEIHELPHISATGQVPYAPNTITTIEPGVYVEGVGGVRQEDDYLIIEGGYERLTTITDYLIEL